MNSAAPRSSASLDSSEPSARLELEEDPPAQRRTWVLQRIGWAVMGLILLGGLSGLLGKSPALVLRPAGIFFFLLLVFRLAGRRTMAEVSNFDLVMLLVVGDAAGTVALGDDHSPLSLVLVVLTLVGLTVLMASMESRWPVIGRALNGSPLVLVRNGQVLTEQMRRARITRDDVLQEARQQHGLANLGQIRYAILEGGGHISIVPWSPRHAASE